MQAQDSHQKKQGLHREKQPYEPPTAILVCVQLNERVLGCNFTSPNLCKYTE
jgi:hypothetical protein